MRAQFLNAACGQFSRIYDGRSLNFMTVVMSMSFDVIIDTLLPSM